MELNEQELLMLDCFMYSDVAPNTKKGKTVEHIIEEFVDPETNEVSLEIIEQKEIEFSGDMTAEKFRVLLTDMRKNEKLKRLKLMETTPEYKGSIRAACFVDPDTDKATVAFRGTGGSYRQWYNNFEGYGEPLQDSQKAAVLFIKSLPYDDIDVTGHSGGGGMAMVATIVCGNKVSRCVSYEGQGVSDEFLELYSEETKRNKHKIKNISGDRDPVNLLMFRIAGESRYLESNAELLFGMFTHGAFGLYTANKEKFEANGGYFAKSDYVEQAWYCKAIHKMTVFMSKCSDKRGVGTVLEYATDFAGVLMGFCISKGWKDPETIKMCYRDLIKSLQEYRLGDLRDVISAIDYIYAGVFKGYRMTAKSVTASSNANPNIKVDTTKLMIYAAKVEAVNRRVGYLDARLNSLYWRVGLRDLWYLMQADLVLEPSWKLSRVVSYLNDTASDFEAVEQKLNKLL